MTATVINEHYYYYYYYNSLNIIALIRQFDIGRVVIDQEVRSMTVDWWFQTCHRIQRRIL